jgi:hypothetical protein
MIVWNWILFWERKPRSMVLFVFFNFKTQMDTGLRKNMTNIIFSLQNFSWDQESLMEKKSNNLVNFLQRLQNLLFILILLNWETLLLEYCKAFYSIWVWNRIRHIIQYHDNIICRKQVEFIFQLFWRPQNVIDLRKWMSSWKSTNTCRLT